MRGIIRTLFRFAHVILAFLGVCLAGICYAIYLYVPYRYAELVWSLLAFVLLINGTIVGSLIKRQNMSIYTDKLTGLGNRALFYLELGLLIDKAKQRGLRDITLAMIDLDDFKKINDAYGHQVGDMVLVKIAEVFKQNARATDTVVRWGGEEFAIILPRTNATGAITVLERIRKDVANFDFGPQVESRHITCSIGFVTSNEILKAAESEQDTNLVEISVLLADKALYDAKKKKNIIKHWVN